MKKIAFLSLAVLLILKPTASVYSQAAGKLEGTITISGAFALYPLAVKWAEEFKKVNPGVKIDLSAGGAGKGMTDVLSKQVDIGMLSREINPEETKKNAYGIAVAKDAVVPTINAKSPVIKDALSKGLKKDAANKLFVTGEAKTWGQVLGTASTVPVRLFTRSDACGAGETWAKYFNKKQEDLLGVGVFGDPGIAQAIQKEPLGIGYNNIAYAYDAKTKKPQNGIVVIPLDLNNNGKIDSDEDFYKTLDALIKAIATGKYPSPPSRDLYFVTNGKPTNKALTEFIKWVLKDGQKYVGELGYINLAKDKLAKETAKVK